MGFGTPVSVIATALLLIAGCGSESQGNAVPQTGDLPAPPATSSPTPISSPIPTPPGSTAPVADGKNWSDPSAWGGTMPPAGAAVVIPAGTTIKLDTDVVVSSLVINGTLSVADKDLSLAANSIVVDGIGSRLVAGSESKPFTNQLVVTLTGNRPDTDQAAGVGSKVLAVNAGGRLELFGEANRRAWTKLMTTAAAGSDTIRVADATGWRVGDRLLLTSTTFQPEDVSERSIKTITGTAITLDRPLEREHLCVTNEVGGTQLTQCGEVALLNRNILIQGDESSVTSRFGGHLMVMGGGAARISGVEFARMGQLGILGRYGFHWHLAGDVSGQFIMNSVVRNAFHKGVVVHGTKNALVSSNIVYDTMGHSIMAAEDGVETTNVFEGNLAALARVIPVANRVIETDGEPANFWMQNPNNVFRNNVAAGAQYGHGFWFDLPKWPTGNFENCRTCTSPRGMVAGGDGTQYPSDRKLWGTPFGEFTGNTAHSSSAHPQGFVGKSVRGSGIRIGSFLAQSRDGAAVLSASSAYWNGSIGMWVDSDPMHAARIDYPQIRVIGAKIADNKHGVNSIAAVFEDSLLSGRVSKDDVTWTDGEAYGGMMMASFSYDHKTDFKNVTFVNWKAYTDSRGIRRGSGIFGMQDGRDRIEVPLFATGIKRVNADLSAMTHCYSNGNADLGNGCNKVRGFAVESADGSLLGTGQTESLVWSNPLLVTPDCQNTNDSLLNVCSGGARRYLRVTVVGLAANTELVRDDGARNTLGSLDSTMLHMERLYRVSTTNWSRVEVHPGHDQNFGTWVLIGLPYASSTASVRDAGRAYDNLDALRASSITGYYLDGDGKTAYLKVFERRGTVVCAAETCN
jgi:G8 domain